MPLGVVSAVQEAGSVLGPLLGAVVLAVADWRAIFVLNLSGRGLALAVAVSRGRRRAAREATPRCPKPGPRGVTSTSRGARARRGGGPAHCCRQSAAACYSDLT